MAVDKAELGGELPVVPAEKDAHQSRASISAVAVRQRGFKGSNELERQMLRNYNIKQSIKLGLLRNKLHSTSA
jgi:hypothetical protein